MGDTKKWYYFALVAMIAALVLEILPYGAVLNFGSPDGVVKRATYSYFNMITFGYANFGPWPTAVFSVAVFIGAAVMTAYKKPLPKLNSAVLVCCIIAFLFSLLPVLQDRVSDIGIVITILLLAATAFLIIARISVWRHDVSRDRKEP